MPNQEGLRTPTTPLMPRADLKIVYRAIADLKPRRVNPRTHSEKQISQLAASIERFGPTTAILIDAHDTIIAGHGRVRAYKKLGIDSVPTIQVGHLSEAEIRALVIADNGIAAKAGWDRDLLALELGELAELDLDFDLEITGFETAEIDLLINPVTEDSPDRADTLAPFDTHVPVVTRPGDLWQAGPHRILCGDALDFGSYLRLMEGKRAQVVFTDPPYNVPIEGHVSGKGRMLHPEFAMASGEMTRAEFTAFLEKTLSLQAAHSDDGAIHFVCMDWRHIGELICASQRVYSECKNICVWEKTNAGMGSLYRSQHEFIGVFKVGTAPHQNNVQLGRHGRMRSNVWRYAGVNSFGHGREEALAAHPTVKPVRLVADALLDCSRRGGIVLDGFLGSGTTLLAADRTGRVGYGLELEPRYVDVAIRRLVEHAGLESVLVETGQPFHEVAKQRMDEAQDDSSRDVPAMRDSEV